MYVSPVITSYLLPNSSHAVTHCRTHHRAHRRANRRAHVVALSIADLHPDRRADSFAYVFAHSISHPSANHWAYQPDGSAHSRTHCKAYSQTDPSAHCADSCTYTIARPFRQTNLEAVTDTNHTTYR